MYTLLYLNLIIKICLNINDFKILCQITPCFTDRTLTSLLTILIYKNHFNLHMYKIQKKKNIWCMYTYIFSRDLNICDDVIWLVPDSCRYFLTNTI